MHVSIHQAAVKDTENKFQYLEVLRKYQFWHKEYCQRKEKKSKEGKKIKDDP